MDAHRLFFQKKQNHVTYNIKKDIPYKLLKPPYKYTRTAILLAAHKKPQLL